MALNLRYLIGVKSLCKVILLRYLGLAQATQIYAVFISKNFIIDSFFSSSTLLLSYNRFFNTVNPREVHTWSKNNLYA